MTQMPNRTTAVETEQAVLGALLLDNAALDRVPDLRAEHFCRGDHQAIYAEACKQIMSGKTCDVISLFDSIGDQVEDCLPYLASLAQNTLSAAAIRRHADTVIERALRRRMIALGSELTEAAMSATDDAFTLASSFVIKLETLGQRGTSAVPVLLSDSLASYADLLNARMEGRVKPIATGFADLDKRLDGGLERGTLTVVAARPGMGKSAFGLALCRNVSRWGSAAFLSMEMSASQVNDRNVAALGKLPIGWLRNPREDDKEQWDRLTHAFRIASQLAFFIDDKTALTVMEIRAKARAVKRSRGLDLLVVDQLSFITGGEKAKKQWELVGDHTRSLIALAKELDVSVVLLCQLNRECESRNNKRPQLSDLAMSGSIEQDAATILFLYRDQVYNADTADPGTCEVNCAKQRQGEPGVTRLKYVGNQSRFEDVEAGWRPTTAHQRPRPRSFE